MLNLTFSDSAAGSLHVMRNRLSADGSPAEVMPLWMALDVGDLSNPEVRQAVYQDLYGDTAEVPQEMQQMLRAALVRLERAHRDCEPVRIWLCPSDPAELCGLMYVCRLFAEESPPISVVQIPAELVDEQNRTVTTYHSTAEIPAKTLVQMITLEQPLGEARRRAYAWEWQDLVRDNAPLRAIVNGRLMGVPEDFYDFALRANLPEGTFTAAWPIGRTLSQMPGVGDAWLFRRLLAMVRTGELVEVAGPTDDHPYSGTFRKA